MNFSKKRNIRTVIIIVLCIISATAGYLLKNTDSPESGSNADSSGNPVKYVCPMNISYHPYFSTEDPKEKCGYCGMDLVADSEGGSDEGDRVLVMSEVAKKLAEIQTSPAERRFVDIEIPMTGKVDFDETRVKTISSWVDGRLDRLFVDYTGVSVKKGEGLVEVYSPTLYSAQEELLQALKTSDKLSPNADKHVKETANRTVNAVRKKLRLLGLNDDQVATLEKERKSSSHMEIKAPIGGIVIHKDAMEGMYVKTGTHIYTIADMTKLWVKLDAYESDLPWLKNGQNVEIKTETFGDKIFEGQISFIDPILNNQTRTAKVRVQVDNEEGLLKPNMFVRAVVKASMADKEESNAPLVIPASAPMITGKRSIVYVQQKGKERPSFKSIEVELGPRAGDYYLVKSGLEEGQNVVVNGNFKIDSALQLRAKPSMMNPDIDTTASERRSTESDSIPAHKNTAAPRGKPQESCPIMGGKINKDVYKDHKGYRVYFCCAGCDVPFMKNPDKFIKKMQKDGISIEKTPSAQMKPQSVCPIMGGKINKDVYKDHKGYRVYFCCAGCDVPFMKNPDKFIKKMQKDGISIEKTPKLVKSKPETVKDKPQTLKGKPKTIQDKPQALKGNSQHLCPMMGGKINKEAYKDYKGYRVYFCCNGCGDMFMKKPDPHIEKMLKDGIKLDKTP